MGEWRSESLHEGDFDTRQKKSLLSHKLPERVSKGQGGARAMAQGVDGFLQKLDLPAAKSVF